MAAALAASAHTIVLDPAFPVIIIDVSLLFYTAYFEAINKFYLANGDIRLAQMEMFKEIRGINAPDLATFKTLAALVVRRGDTIDYANIDKNAKFGALFKSVIERLIKRTCKSVSNTPYRFGNAILIKDCRRADNWRCKKFPFYKQQRAARDIITNHLQFNGKIVEQFWTDVYPKLENELGIRILTIPTLEADDLAYFAKLEIRRIVPNTDLIIVTRDYDYLQLVDEKTRVINFEGIDLNERGFGSPELNLAIKIMTGDASDNVPPLFYGCGEKTAQKILAKLYPVHENDIDLAAKDFINAIERLENIATISRQIMEILTESSSSRSRGRPITSSSRMPSETIITTNLTYNTLIIQMSKIPELYRAQFNEKYIFTTYDIARTRFDTRNLPANVVTQGTKPHSADDVLLKNKSRSNKQALKSH
jgi:5'-3' exonuclease